MHLVRQMSYLGPAFPIPFAMGTCPVSRLIEHLRNFVNSIAQINPTLHIEAARR